MDPGSGATPKRFTTYHIAPRGFLIAPSCTPYYPLKLPSCFVFPSSFLPLHFTSHSFASSCFILYTLLLPEVSFTVIWPFLHTLLSLPSHLPSFTPYCTFLYHLLSLKASFTAYCPFLYTLLLLPPHLIAPSSPLYYPRLHTLLLLKASFSTILPLKASFSTILPFKDSFISYCPFFYTLFPVKILQHFIAPQSFFLTLLPLKASFIPYCLLKLLLHLIAPFFILVGEVKPPQCQGHD